MKALRGFMDRKHPSSGLRQVLKGVGSPAISSPKTGPESERRRLPCSCILHWPQGLRRHGLHEGIAG